MNLDAIHLKTVHLRAEERFERIDKRGHDADRNCFACLNCKAIGTADRSVLTTCAAGLWGDKKIPLHTVVIGKAEEFRNRQTCPSWESSR